MGLQLSGSIQLEGNLLVTGSANSVFENILVSGKLTAQEIETQFVSASIIYSSGSNKFGDEITDNQQFTGSVDISGSLGVNGIPTFGSVSGSVNTIPKFTSGYLLGDSGIFDNGTNVGIGTTSPSFLLTVGDAGTTVDSNIQIASSAIGTGNLFFGDATGGGVASYVGFIQYQHSENNMVFGTTSTERMRITSVGNVGIGTTSPSAKLDVNETSSGAITNCITLTNASNTINTEAGLFFAPTTATGNIRGSIITGFQEDGNNAIGLKFYTGTGATISEKMRITSVGNVGIGTDSPGAKLDVNGDIYSRTGFGIYANTFSPYSGNMNIALGGSGNNLIVSGGNVGIGTASPSERLQVAGNINVGTTLPLLLSNDTSQLNLVNGIYYTTDNSGYGIGFGKIVSGTKTNQLVIRDSGNVLIGKTTDDGRGKLQVSFAKTQEVASFTNTNNASSGDFVIVTNIGSNADNTNSYHYIASTGTSDRFYIYGNGTFATVSDQRLKKNISTVKEKYLDKVLKLDVVNYNWKDQPDNHSLELGLIAQQVEELLPSIINENRPDDEGNVYKSVQVSALPYILIKAIQEQQTQIEELKSRLEVLETK
jgi:hypothetical protein